MRNNNKSQEILPSHLLYCQVCVYEKLHGIHHLIAFMLVLFLWLIIHMSYESVLWCMSCVFIYLVNISNVIYFVNNWYFVYLVEGARFSFAKHTKLCLKDVKII